MIDRKHELPIKRQAELVGISRGSVYYVPQPASAADLVLMRVIDELLLEHPFAGARMLRDMLNARGLAVGRKHVSTLMRRMGIEALYRKPSTSKPHPEHAVYPYLLRALAIERANHVWAMDLTYIPMARGFVYLAAIIDWASRKVLAWDVSISMEADFCVRVLDAALARHGKPEIFNTDQRQPVHEPGVHRAAEDRGHRHQHGRARLLARQRVRRAAVAQREVRGGVLASLRNREPGARGHRALPELLQQHAAAHRARRQDARQRVLATLAAYPKAA